MFGLAFLLLVTFRSIVIQIKGDLPTCSTEPPTASSCSSFRRATWSRCSASPQRRDQLARCPPVLFGLSMDYHVFILSRSGELCRPRWRSPMRPSSAGPDDSLDGDQRRARHGRGLPVFVTLAFLDFKELGLGLAAAVLIDATIIRGVLLPATMKLLGDWNWYLPAGSEWLPHAGPAAISPRSSNAASPYHRTSPEPLAEPTVLRSSARNSRPAPAARILLPPAATSEAGAPAAWCRGRQQARPSTTCCSRAWHWCLLRRLPATTTATTSLTQRLSTPTYALTDIDLGSDPVDFVPKDILGRVRTRPSARAAARSSSASVPSVRSTPTCAVLAMRRSTICPMTHPAT